MKEQAFFAHMSVCFSIDTGASCSQSVNIDIISLRCNSEVRVTFAIETASLVT
jgi:hypothetical protein